MYKCTFIQHLPWTLSLQLYTSYHLYCLIIRHIFPLCACITDLFVKYALPSEIKFKFLHLLQPLARSLKSTLQLPDSSVLLLVFRCFALRKNQQQCPRLFLKNCSEISLYIFYDTVFELNLIMDSIWIWHIGFLFPCTSVLELHVLCLLFNFLPDMRFNWFCLLEVQCECTSKSINKLRKYLITKISCILIFSLRWSKQYHELFLGGVCEALATTKIS